QTDSAEHFAQTLKISIKVLENLRINYGSHRRQVTISNPGTVEFPAKRWEIYFSQIYIPELGHLASGGIELSHVQGQLYKLTPAPGFKPIPAGGSLSFSYLSNGNSVAYTDSFPNWYIIYKGSKPLIVESTRGEAAKFAVVHDTPDSWKSDSDPSSSSFDRHNPPTSADRFVLDSSPDLSHDPLPVIPTPLQVSNFDKGISVYMHQGAWVVIGETSFHSEMEYLASAWQLKISTSLPSSHYIKFSKGNSFLSDIIGDRSCDEGYRIDVSPSKNIITIYAEKSQGAFYAVQSLIALRNTEGKLPAITIRDAPRFNYRGLMLDIARNFQLIRLMAMYKLNKLHLHLSDDEGWRIEIPGLDELTSIGGSRCHDLKETRCLLPFLGSGPDKTSSGTGYLKVTDYKEILAYAARHHIEVIPEIDVPGHAHAAVVAMKQRYIDTGSDQYLLTEPNDESNFKSVQGFTDNVINPCLNSTYTFLRKVISEIYHMHKDTNPLSRFHFGGDEVPDSAWSHSPSCRRLMMQHPDMTIKRYFLQQVALILKSLGLDMAAWEDGFNESEGHSFSPHMFPQKDVISYSWKNPPHMNLLKSAYTMANSGYKVVLASATNLYLDHPQEPDPAERGLVWATRFVSTKRSFSYSPLQLYSSTNVDIRGNMVEECVNDEYTCPSLKRPGNVIGMEAILFGELITSVEILDFMLLPRLLAVAERAWHEAKWEELPVGSERKSQLLADWNKFTNTLAYRELPRLDRLGFKYRIPPPGAILSPDKTTMLVNVTYPSQTVEISRNGGFGWAVMLDSSTKVNPGERIMLRTKAGTRTSRPILFNPNRLFTLED
ncbi:beta-hexosaminidase, partial [Elysia marginata]